MAIGRIDRSARGIIRKQDVNPEKVALAKRLRREITPAEAKLWHALRRDGLENLYFRRQQVIDGYIVDFFCNAVSLAVEVDGAVHDTQREYDAKREEDLRYRGVQTLRFTNDEVLHSLLTVLQRIREAAFARRPSDQPPTVDAP
ncbi:MAG: endonuclease domain-containing protein [Dehalococcoidia bacterium]